MPLNRNTQATFKLKKKLKTNGELFHVMLLNPMSKKSNFFYSPRKLLLIFCQQKEKFVYEPDFVLTYCKKVTITII